MATRNFNVKNGLTVGNATIDATSGNANLGNVATAQVLATANITAPQIISNATTGTAPFIVSSTTTVANLAATTATTAGTVTTASQPNITSVGTLTSLTVSGTSNLGNVGNVIITGGSSGYYLQTDGAGGLSWASVPTGTGISNGTSNINIFTSGGNVTTSVAGNANVFVVTGTGANVAGTFNATGNANVGNIGATTAVFTTGNITTINSGLLQNGNSNVTITANGNVTLNAVGGARIIATSAGANVTGTLGVSGNANVGNLGTAQVLATANITTPQVIANVAQGTSPLLVNSTTLVANLNADLLDGFNTATGATASTVAVRDTNGNITANFFIGNGSQLTGLQTDRISNGNSNVSIPAANGNVNIIAVGNTTLVVTGTGANITGTLNATGNANVGNLGTAGQVIATGNVTSSANLVSDNIIGRTGALTIKSAGTNTNINLQPNGTGNIDANSAYITNVKSPFNLNDAATKAYVDSLVSTGISVHEAVAAATTTTLATTTGGTITYNNGASGVGANLVTTGSFNLIDTANVQTVGTRILVKNEANAAWNGIYTWANATTIVRATDADSYGAADPNALGQNDLFFVTGGQDNMNTSWIVATVGTITFGTTNINFSQFSATQDYTAGTGLTLSPNLEFSISNTTVTAGTYGNGDRVATFTVNSQGQLTAASNTVIAANAANLTGTTLAGTVVNSSLTSVGTLGSLAVTGNATAGNVYANSGTIGASVGNITTINSGLLQNGNSNISITANGNINISATGTPSELVITSTGVNVAGYLTSNGNITGGNISTGGALSVTGNANVGNIGTGRVIATGNISGTQLISNVATGTAPFVVTSTTQVANLNAATAGTAGSATTAGTVTTNAQPNITSVGTLTSLTVDGNITVGGNLNASNNFFVVGELGANGDGEQGGAVGLVAGNGGATGNTLGGTISIVGGSATVGGNVTLSPGSGVGTDKQGGWTIIRGGVSTGSAQPGNIVFQTTTPTTSGATNQTLANRIVISGNVVNVTTNVAATSTTSGALVVVGGMGVGGNIYSGGLVSATGNVSGGNLTTGGVLSVTGNANVGNLGTAGSITATGNVSGGNLTTGGALSVTGNANVGNIGTAAGVFTGNITAGNVYANAGTIGANLLTGTLTTASQPNITSIGTLSSLVVSGNVTTGNVRLNGGLTSNRSNVAVTTNTVIDQFAPATFRTAKYIISASGDNGYQSIETLLVHDGTDAYITIYGSISSNVSSEIINLSANINGVSGNVSLYASNIGANVRVNIVSSYIQI